MASAALQTIVTTGFTVALLHATLPTHWMPFVAVARARKWTRARTMGVVALTGGAHVGVTTLIGLAIAWLGFEMTAGFEQWTHRVLAGLLFIFAGYFWWRQVTGRGCDCAGEAHSHEGAEAKERTALWSLFALLAISPCEGFLPIYLTAVPYGWSGVVLLSVVLAVGTLGGMMTLTWCALIGWERFYPRWAEAHEAGLIGTFLGLLGAVVLVLPE